MKTNEIDLVVSSDSERDSVTRQGDGILITFLLLVVFRLMNAFIVRTQFDPDEYWQGLEPARLLVYGKGWLTWEWMPEVAIRSWIYPVILSIPWHGKFGPKLLEYKLIGSIL